MRTFLHVGCGTNYKDSTTRVFAGAEWREIRLDIDPNVQPDIIGSMLDMFTIADESVDAVYSANNIEHLYSHEVPIALAEFRRVLKPDGFLIIACPDLQSVCALIAEDKLSEVAYNSPAGPITPHDILYGLRICLAEGNLHMAHRCGFTSKTLTEALLSAGFAAVYSGRTSLTMKLWAFALPRKINEMDARCLATDHLHGQIVEG